MIISPESLHASLQDEEDIAKKIDHLSDTLVSILMEIGNVNDIEKIRNVVGSLVNQDEIFDRIYQIYEEIYTIWQRLRAVVTKSSLDDGGKEKIKERAAQIISNNIHNLQREVFFKIVNAKEVAEGEKNEDGPAMLFPGIEKIKTVILRNIHAQTQQLRPAAANICKSFQGIAEKYVETEEYKAGEKPGYDTIASVYEQEKALDETIGADISAKKIDESEFLDTLIKKFGELIKSYKLKILSLHDKRSSGVVNFEYKLEILKEGCRLVDETLKPLKVLKSLVQRFPSLEKQLDYFAESHYQAKAVMQFMEEVNQEMSKVFTQYTLESFTVISLLRFKLNGTSHMYESIFYYYAVVQIEADMISSLQKRYAGETENGGTDLISKEIEDSGITTIVNRLHDYIAEMNTTNSLIHHNFLDYKEIPDLGKLKAELSKQTETINNLHNKVITDYKAAQKIFLEFLSNDLGSTDLISQFNGFLKNTRSDEATLIRKSFNKLLATKRNELETLEKKLKVQFESKLEPDKIAAMAVLKVRMDFQAELLKEVQEYPRAQDVFIHILKEFIKTQDEQDSSHESDNTIIWLVQRNFTNELKQFKSLEANTFKKILHNPYLSDRDFAVCFLAANITPQEIESFSRLLPGLPRNEFQLDSPYGRILLDIKSMFKERLQVRGGSGAHITEKVYEKRERIKLINNISLFLKSSSIPFFKKIDTEELKINHLISLQKRKYQKDLNEIIKYWQYLIQEQISPGQGARGRFRKYTPSEKVLMMKYISPEQLNVIERQLESSYDLEAESRLFEVEAFLMEIIDGLFKNFKQDLRIKATFENYEKGKKIRQAQFQNEEYQNILESDSFVPKVRECLEKVMRVTRQRVIDQFLNYWEYLIDQRVPASERRKIKPAPKSSLPADSDNALHYISTEQLNNIWRDLELIQTIRDQTIKNQLLKTGLPVIKIAQQAINLFKEGQKKLVVKEVSLQRQSKMKEFCNNKAFQRAIKTVLPN